MKFMSFKNFIGESEAAEMLSFVKPEQSPIENEHIRRVNEATYGWSVLCDMTGTKISEEVSRFQGDSTRVESVPDIYRQIMNRIAETVGISQDHVFFQYIFVGANGQVRKHYDAGMPGFVTYKCNICVSGPADDCIFVGDQTMSIGQHDLYCFEANLYKHWMLQSPVPRIHLSYGFLVPNAELGWGEDDPRVRLSNRIWKAYIGR